MSAHTQGPWRIGNIMQYVGYDCTTVGLMIGPVYLSCFEYGQKRCGEITDHVRERMLTDARLISAAPDMYEALKAARECILGRANIEYRKHGESTPLQDIYEELIAQIDAAMAKAGQ